MNLPHNLKETENNKQIEMMFFELMKRFNNGDSLPLLDPIDDMEIEDENLEKLVEAKGKLDTQLKQIE